MPNPMMQQLNRRNNPLAMIAEFKKFAQTMTPERASAEIERLLTSGQMSKEQFVALKEQAKLFVDFLR